MFLRYNCGLFLAPFSTSHGHERTNQDHATRNLDQAAGRSGNRDGPPFHPGDGGGRRHEQGPPEDLRAGWHATMGLRSGLLGCGLRHGVHPGQHGRLAVALRRVREVEVALVVADQAGRAHGPDARALRLQRG